MKNKLNRFNKAFDKKLSEIMPEELEEINE